uniref:Retrotransposon gag domain-containing protein n=1 Tax=Cannabis sativa TaxID=3483 RepID=A0A803QJR7_CANSA
MQDLRQKMAITLKENSEDDEVDEESPFSMEIQIEPLPPNFKESRMTPYDAKTDPKYHLRGFNELMKMKKVSCKIRCQYFVVTLKEVAYKRLGPGAITYWKQFLEEFFQQHQVTSDYIVPVTRRMSNDEHKFAIAVGIRPGSTLWGNMLRRELDDIEDFYERPEKYIHIEERYRFLEMDISEFTLGSSSDPYKVY